MINLQKIEHVFVQALADLSSAAVLVVLALSSLVMLQRPPYVVVSSTTGNAYYVSNSGLDTNPGTSTAPFASIQKAAGIVQPGDTVYVLPGTYGPVYSSRSGTSSAPITYISTAKWGAKISSSIVSSATGYSLWSNTGNYVNIVGFDVDGSTVSSWNNLSTDGIVGIKQAASYGQIISNEVHDLNTPACNYGGTGIDTTDYYAAGNSVIDNVIFSTGPAVPNTCNQNHGIYIGDTNARVSNNIIDNIRGGAGIHCWHACTGVTITNNLTFSNSLGGITVGAGDSPYFQNALFDNSVIANNIAINNSRYGASPPYGFGIREFENDGTHTVGKNNLFLNNLVYNNPSGNLVLIEGNTDSGTLIANPVFVKYQGDGSGDYHLVSLSPGVNAGSSVRGIPYDLDGYARPQGLRYNIGPYENPRIGVIPQEYPFPAIVSSSVIAPTAAPVSSPKVATADGASTTASTPKAGQIQLVDSNGTPLANVQATISGKTYVSDGSGFINVAVAQGGTLANVKVDGNIIQVGRDINSKDGYVVKINTVTGRLVSVVAYVGTNVPAPYLIGFIVASLAFTGLIIGMSQLLANKLSAASTRQY